MNQSIPSRHQSRSNSGAERREKIDVHLGPDDVVEAKHDVSEAKHDVVPRPHDVVEATHDVVAARDDVIEARDDVEAKHDVVDDVVQSEMDVVHPCKRRPFFRGAPRRCCFCFGASMELIHFLFSLPFLSPTKTSHGKHKRARRSEQEPSRTRSCVQIVVVYKKLALASPALNFSRRFAPHFASRAKNSPPICTNKST